MPTKPNQTKIKTTTTTQKCKSFNNTEKNDDQFSQWRQQSNIIQLHDITSKPCISKLHSVLCGDDFGSNANVISFHKKYLLSGITVIFLATDILRFKSHNAWRLSIRLHTELPRCPSRELCLLVCVLWAYTWEAALTPTASFKIIIPASFPSVWIIM